MKMERGGEGRGREREKDRREMERERKRAHYATPHLTPPQLLPNQVN